MVVGGAVVVVDFFGRLVVVVDCFDAECGGELEHAAVSNSIEIPMATVGLVRRVNMILFLFRQTLIRASSAHPDGSAHCD